MKECSKCLIQLDLNSFSRNKSSPDGLRSICKRCDRQSGKQYYNTNKENISKQRKSVYDKEKRSYRAKKWYLLNAEYKKQKTSAYVKANRSQYSAYSRSFYAKNKDNFQFIFGNRLRTRLWRSLKKKTIHIGMSELIGCSWDSLKFYLESKFTEGMSWDNYGYYGWHIDHIIPLSSFDLKDTKQLQKACHYTNLQPLWAKDNLVKSDKILGEYCGQQMDDKISE